MIESERIRELNSYKILDSLPEAEYDEIVELASALCNTPIAQISIVDNYRQWIKASHGLMAKETDRKYSFCSHALNNPNRVMVVSDSLKDLRFKDNPLVLGEPQIRFYAGSPLITASGNVLGTLCVIDTKPRRISYEMKRGLRILANKVMQYLEVRKNNISLQNELKDSIMELNSLQQKYKSMKRDASIGTWQWNLRTKRLTLSKSLGHFLKLDNDEVNQKKIFYDDIILIIESLKGKRNDHPVKIKHRLINHQDKIIWAESSIQFTVSANGNLKQINATVFDISLRVKYNNLLEDILFSVSHTIRRPISSLQGLIHLVELMDDEAEIKLYSKKMKVVVDEMDIYTRKLTNLFLNKRNQADE